MRRPAALSATALLAGFAVGAAVMAPTASAAEDVVITIDVPFPDLITTAELPSLAWSVTGEPTSKQCRLFDVGGESPKEVYYASSCPSPFAPPTYLSDGDYEVVLEAWHGESSDSASQVFSIDRYAEVSIGEGLREMHVNRRVVVPLESEPSASGETVVSYDVQHKSRPWATSFTSYVSPESWQGVTTDSVVLTTVPKGSHVCLRARANESDGRVTPYGAEGCTSIAMDNRDLAKLLNSSGGSKNTDWVVVKDTRFTYGSAIRTRTQGHRAVTPPVMEWGPDLALIATTCPTCGRVAVRHVGRTNRDLGTIDLSSPTRKDRVVFRLPGPKVIWGGVESTLRVTVVSSGKPVMIDGFGVYYRAG